jgi:hypothetical protein
MPQHRPAAGSAFDFSEGRGPGKSSSDRHEENRRRKRLTHHATPLKTCPFALFSGSCPTKQTNDKTMTPNIRAARKPSVFARETAANHEQRGR